MLTPCKRYIGALLVCCMLLTLVPITAVATSGEATPTEAAPAKVERSVHNMIAVGPGFDDVARGSWYYYYIRFVKEHDIMQGTGDGNFAPHATLSRAMFATVLWRLAGEPTVSEQLTLLDVPPGRWYSDALAWAYSVGIVRGTGTGRLSPGDNITREQMAVMLFRFAEVMEEDIDTPQTLQWTRFNDRDSVSDWAEEAMRWAVHNGLLIGTSSTTLHPQDTAIRAQGATVLRRFVAGPTETPPPLPPPEPPQTVNIRPLLHREFEEVKDQFGTLAGTMLDDAGKIYYFYTGIALLVSDTAEGRLIDSILIDYYYADSAQFHFDSINGTSTRNYVISRLGDPFYIDTDDWLEELGAVQAYYYLMEHYTDGMDIAVFYFNRDNQVVAILFIWLADDE